MSLTSSKGTLDPLPYGGPRPKAIEYLTKNKEGKESVREFVGFSRQILMAQISINTKNEENERLKEYITMEQEKLDEARKLLDEDKEKFEKLMTDIKNQTKKASDQVKQKGFEKQLLIKQKESLESDIAQKQNKIKKYDDDLKVFKEQKHFLDIVAMQAGRKKYNPKKKTSYVEAAEKQVVDEKEGSTFLTAVGGGKQKKQKPLKDTKGAEAYNSSYLFKGQKNQGSKESFGENNQDGNEVYGEDYGLQIDMADPYEDDDFTIYF